MKFRDCIIVFHTDPFPVGRSELEQCVVYRGLEVLGLVHIYQAHVVPNRHEDPANNFRILKSDVPTMDYDLIGHGHTHVGPGNRSVSWNDVKHARSAPHLLGLVHHQDYDEIKLYDGMGWIGNVEYKRSYT